MTLLIAALIIIALIVLNGFFVAAEFALIGTPRTLIEKEAEEGSALAKRVLEILSDPKRQDRYIATAQLGITVASLGLGMYGEHTLASWVNTRLIDAGWGEKRWIASHSIASVGAVTVLTYLHIVLGEMVPKSLALHGPHKVAKWITPAMQFTQWIVYPLVVALNALGNQLLRVFRIERKEAGHLKSTDELSYIVDESETGGELGAESANVLRELLEFGDLTAGESMVPRTQIVGIELEMPNDEIREILRRRPHTRYVVYEGDLDKIVGFVHVKDLMRSIRSTDGLLRREVRPVPFLPESSNLESVLRSMRRFRSQLAVVMDEHGGTAGILTVEDLFEEVVGDISEDQAEVPEILMQPDGTYLVRGTARLTDLGEKLETELEHEDVDTVSGLVLALLERPAQAGDEVRHGDAAFKVITVRGRGVGECRVSIQKASDSGLNPG